LASGADSDALHLNGLAYTELLKHHATGSAIVGSRWRCHRPLATDQGSRSPLDSSLSLGAVGRRGVSWSGARCPMGHVAGPTARPRSFPPRRQWSRRPGEAAHGCRVPRACRCRSAQIWCWIPSRTYWWNRIA